MPSNRLVPQQFAAGLTVDATRMEQDLKALANRLNDPLPTDLARRWMQTHLTMGIIPDRMARPNSLPWMGAYNATGLATTTTQQPVTDFKNKWRQKGIKQSGIDPTIVPGVAIPTAPFGFTAPQDIYSWEVAWGQTQACLLDQWTFTFATDNVYLNPFLYGPNPPPGKVHNQPVDDVVFQVIVDSALDSPNRTASTLPILLREFKAWEYLVSYISPPVNDMTPPMGPQADRTVVTGMCVQIKARQPLPENCQVRLIVSLPRYPSYIPSAVPTPITMSSWGAYPFQTAVMSSHVTLLEPIA